MNWEPFRRSTDGSIDLVEAYNSVYVADGHVVFFLRRLETLQLVKSRQVAALAIVTARELFS